MLEPLRPLPELPVEGLGQLRVERQPGLQPPHRLFGPVGVTPRNGKNRTLRASQGGVAKNPNVEIPSKPDDSGPFCPATGHGQELKFFAMPIRLTEAQSRPS
jgi:hypothetical protein